MSSASVVDPRLRNWFTNTAHSNDQSRPSQYNSTAYHPTCLHPNANLLRGDNAQIYKMRTFHSTKPTALSTSNNQLFGTSIFNHNVNNNSNNNNSNGQMSSSNNRHKNTVILNNASPIAPNLNNTTAHSPTPPLPQPPPPNLSDSQLTAMKHLITTLSIGIEEMNQYLDKYRDSDHFGVHSKTANCRNEMVSTLSYYQTYIQSNHEHHSRMLSHFPLSHDFDHADNTEQKRTVLNVIRPFIGTPQPTYSDDAPSPLRPLKHTHTRSHIPSVPIPSPSPSQSPLTPPPNLVNFVAKSHEQMLEFKEEECETIKCVKSELNAFAEPYLSQSPMSNGYESTTPYFEQMQSSQNRSEEKECEHNHLYSDKSIEHIEYDNNSSNVHTFDSNEVDKESIITPPQTTTTQPQPQPQKKTTQPTHKRKRRKRKTKKTNNQNVPLWSAIAKKQKQQKQQKQQSKNDEKTSKKVSTKVTKPPPKKPSEKLQQKSQKKGAYLSSCSSSNSSNNQIVTPSPSPPKNNENVNKTQQQQQQNKNRIFVSNLPSNVSDYDIRSAFGHCGEIENTVWFPSRTDGKFYGSGLITFVDSIGSENALRMNQQFVLGRVIRCEYSQCEDPVKVKPPGCRTIYLNNVPRAAKEERIRQVFKHCGKVKRVRFHERDTKRTGGAFVEFENTSSCDKALELHGKIVDNHPLYVDYQRY